MSGYFAELDPRLNLGSVSNYIYCRVEEAVDDVGATQFKTVESGLSGPNIVEAQATDIPLLIQRLARGPVVTTILYVTARGKKPNDLIKVPLIGFRYNIIPQPDGEAFHMPTGVFGFREMEESSRAAFAIRNTTERMAVLGLGQALSEPLRPETPLNKLDYPDFPDRISRVYDGIESNTQCSALITIDESPRDALEFAGRTSVLKHFKKR